LRITHKDLGHYISRCEKAIEYIENEMPYLEEPDEEIEFWLEKYVKEKNLKYMD
jgi:hypothetical protein